MAGFVPSALQFAQLLPIPGIQRAASIAAPIANLVSATRAEKKARRAQAEQQARAREALSQALAESTARLAAAQAGTDRASQAIAAQREAALGAGAEEARNRLAAELSRRNVSTLNPFAAARIADLERTLAQQAGQVRGAGLAQQFQNAATAAQEAANLRARLGQSQATLEAGFPQFDVDTAQETIRGFSEAAGSGLRNLLRNNPLARNVQAPAATRAQLPPIPEQARAVSRATPSSLPGFLGPDERGTTLQERLFKGTRAPAIQAQGLPGLISRPRRTTAQFPRRFDVNSLRAQGRAF